MTQSRIAPLVCLLLFVCGPSLLVCSTAGFLSIKTTEEGSVLLRLERDTTEMLYAVALTHGAGSNALGLDRGSLGSTSVVAFEKVHNSIMLVERNVSVREGETSGQSVSESFARAIHWSFPILSDTAGIEIDITAFLLRDAMSISQRLQRSGEGQFSLVPSRSYVKTTEILNFPLNTEVDVVQTFSGRNSGYNLAGVVPSLAELTMTLHHSFFALPDDGFVTRTFDPAAGSWPTQYLQPNVDIGSSVYEQLTYRHRLFTDAGKGSNTIVYFVDSDIPEPMRSAVVEGVSWWAQAFEAAGYPDAFKVEFLPDSIHPMDVRYNVVQWVHRKERGWSYGTFYSDPRTGEILKGKVTLGSRRVHHDAVIFAGLLQPYGSPDSSKEQQLQEAVLARLRQLAAHEVGHTLGLGHNFAASVVAHGSVMDYPHPRIDIVDGKLSLENAYWDGIGAWDKAAITMLYGELPYGVSLREWRDSIVQDMRQRGITYISDADSRPQRSSHVQAHLWDNGADLVKELEHLYAVRKLALEEFGIEAIAEGRPRAELLESFVPLYFLHRYQTEAVIKGIGGRQYSFGHTDASSLELYPGAQQRRALEGVLQSLSPEFLTVSSEITELIPPFSPGYTGEADATGFTGYGIDEVGLSRQAADATFALMLHPQRIERVAQQSSEREQLTMQELLGTLTETVHQNAVKHENAIAVEVWQSYLNQLMRLTQNEGLSVRGLGHIREELQANREVLDTLSKRASVHQSSFQCMLDQLDAYFSDPTAVVSALPAPQTLPQGSPIGQDQCWFCQP